MKGSPRNLQQEVLIRIRAPSELSESKTYSQTLPYLLRGDKRSIGTAALLIFFITTSIAVYYLHNQVLEQEVIVTSVNGRVEPSGVQIALEITYQIPLRHSFEYKQGDTFYAEFHVWGNGTVKNLLINTPGFDASFVSPGLPLRVNNFLNASIITVGITVLRCCYNGSVSFILTGTN